MTAPRIERALISVSDKRGLVELAQTLAKAGVAMYSTGGTRKFLEEAGFEVFDIAAYTGFPEMLDGRVKTLHPKIFGGILARRDRTDDMEAIAEHGILGFELVIVNLYPFAATIAKPGVTTEEAVEQIDIGGPSLVRATAKNHPFITIVCDPDEYPKLAQQIGESGATTFDYRRQLAAQAFAHTARYDATIASYMEGVATGETVDRLPPVFNLRYAKRDSLRYGENPHQAAGFYVPLDQTPRGWATADKRHGKELSYNNLLDLDSALAIVRDLPQPACAIIKHNNPCGAATASDLATAFRRGYDGDPVSAFGSVLAFNRVVDVATAEALAEPGRFIEAIAAPDFEAQAFEILTTKPKWKNNVRLLAVGELGTARPDLEFRRLDGGLLVQEIDAAADPEGDWKVVTERQPTDAELDDLKFAWHMVRFVKSNAITLAKGGMLLGVGAGQMSRVDSVRIALEKGGDNAKGGVLGSDAFFPFPDSIELIAGVGVQACIQPGGSKQDPEVIAACNRLGVAMIFTGRRHFKH